MGSRGGGEVCALSRGLESCAEVLPMLATRGQLNYRPYKVFRLASFKAFKAFDA